MSDENAIESKIQALEHEMSRTQKNKATNYRKYCTLLYCTEYVNDAAVGWLHYTIL